MTRASEDQTVPDGKSLADMWTNTDFSEVIEISPEIAEYVESLKRTYLNGNVVYKKFVLPNDKTLDWYASRNRFHDMGFFENFWIVDSVQKSLPYKLDKSLNFYSDKTFAWSSPFVLGGNMAWALSSGGAYERHSRGAVDAKKLADLAANEMIHDDYDNILVFESHLPWSSFFMDVAWDGTWVIIDKLKRFVHVLIATDTD